MNRRELIVGTAAVGVSAAVACPAMAAPADDEFEAALAEHFRHYMSFKRPSNLTLSKQREYALRRAQFARQCYALGKYPPSEMAPADAADLLYWEPAAAIEPEFRAEWLAYLVRFMPMCI